MKWTGWIPSTWFRGFYRLPRQTPQKPAEVLPSELAQRLSEELLKPREWTHEYGIACVSVTFVQDTLFDDEPRWYIVDRNGEWFTTTGWTWTGYGVERR